MNSTVSGNSASSGGGLSDARGTVILAQTLISGNTAAGQGAELSTVQGTVIANDFNLFGHGGNARVSGFTPGATDIVPAATLTAILDTTLLRRPMPSLPAARLLTRSPKPTAPQYRPARRSAPQDGDGDAVAECDVGAFEGVVGSLPPPALPPPAAPSPPAPPPAPPEDLHKRSRPLRARSRRAGDSTDPRATLPFIRFDVDIPESAGFLQFDYTFTGADRAVSGSDRIDTRRGQAAGQYRGSRRRVYRQRPDRRATRLGRHARRRVSKLRAIRLASVAPGHHVHRELPVGCTGFRVPGPEPAGRSLQAEMLR
jgi:hypothetical protein